VQIVPDHVALAAAMMPSGREAFGSSPGGAWRPETLGEDALARMRAPMDVHDTTGEEQSSGDEGDDGEGGAEAGDGERTARRPPAGSFPGTRGEYHGDAYY
jgi:hypothetical protein